MILIGCILLLILIMLLIWYSLPRLNKRRRVQSYNSSVYPLAWAGQPKISGKSATSVSVDVNCFYGKDGERLQPDKYLHFVVSGNSMQFCGIRDKDLLFVAKNFRIVDLTDFPCVLVLKNSATINADTTYKVRRAWGIFVYGDDRFESVVRDIIASEDFKAIKNLKSNDGASAYREDESLIDDFLRNRLPKYESKYINCTNPDEWDRTVVISTTFDTDEKLAHFSIHPIKNIVGIVRESFTVAH